MSSVNDPDPEVRLHNRTAFQAALDFCSDIACRHMTGLPGVFHASTSEEQAVRTAASETAFRLEAAGRKQILYAIEPHIGSICATPRDTRRFLEQVGGLSLTLDYGHFIHAGFSNQEVHPLLAFTSHIHLRGGRKGCLQAPVADSTIDLAGILERLRALHYDGYACCEYVWTEWQDCNRTDNLSETLALKELVSEFLASAT